MEKPRSGFAREVARKLLKDSGIKKPPVDLKVILHNRGYEYLEIDSFLNDIDAIFVNKDGRIYAAVNAKHHVHRQRFSLAHEFGHISLGHDVTSHLSDATLDNEPTESSHSAGSPFEAEANIFAGELLVPLDMLKMEFKKTTDLQELSKIFVVSKEVIGVAISTHMSSLY